jgi:nucleoside phosphorylase
MAAKLKRRLFKEAYTVALICPLEVEMSAVRYMLDNEHAPLPLDEHDPNQYILGELSGHNVVIASLPEGSQGTNSAAAVAVHLARSFPAVSLRLLVGIGGGVPAQEVDIRLGDVVISTPSGTSGGVVEYDLGKQNPDFFERKGFLCPPPPQWRSIITLMRSEHRTRPNKIKTYVSDMITKFPLLNDYQWPGADSDVLFSAEYEHATKDRTCLACEKSRIVDRSERRLPDQPHIFYGLIASGNRVLKHARERDRISRDAGGAICFEMEAAGLMNHFPCIVLRGICDYADSHKNDAWHAYAAATAAACSKEILSFMEPKYGMSLLSPVVKMTLSETNQTLEALNQGVVVLECVAESAPMLVNEVCGL